MNKAEYLAQQLRGVDDQAFTEVVDAITDRAAETEERHNDAIVHIADIAERIDEVYDSWGKPSGLLTGYPSLDEKIGGLGKGHVILIGGETSNGKSALATNIAVNISKQRPVLYITLEMLQEELGARIKHVNGGNIDGLNLMFQAEFRLNYLDIEPTIKRAQEEGDVEVVVLDYLQYLGRGMRNEEVAKMSKEIKSLALKYEIPFIVIVSLRKGEGGKARRKWTDIWIEDFMGTGSIGYDADTAMLASRKDLDNNYDPDGIWIKVLKTRNSALDFNQPYLRFEWDQTKITDNWEAITQWLDTPAEGQPEYVDQLRQQRSGMREAQ